MKDLNLDIKALRAFAAVVEEGSFTAAAQRIVMSKSMCSKIIADLESFLGARLLTRTTRAVTPTAAGMSFYTEVGGILARLDAATEAVRSTTLHASGPLKLGAPVQYMLNVFEPHLLRFMTEYPDVQLDVVLEDARTDLTRDGYDAVLRIGLLEDSNLHARHLHDTPILLVASPDYIQARGNPGHPSDLRHHLCLHYTNLRGAGTWPLRQGTEVIYQKITPAFSSNNNELLRRLAIAGKGIALTPRFQVADDLEAGRLVAVMPDYGLPGAPVHVLYSSRKNVSAALSAFLDFVATLRFE